jgi:hypothetical protein
MAATIFVLSWGSKFTVRHSNSNKALAIYTGHFNNISHVPVVRSVTVTNIYVLYCVH